MLKPHVGGVRGDGAATTERSGDVNKFQRRVVERATNRGCGGASWRGGRSLRS